MLVGAPGAPDVASAADLDILPGPARPRPKNRSGLRRSSPGSSSDESGNRPGVECRPADGPDSAHAQETRPPGPGRAAYPAPDRAISLDTRPARRAGDSLPGSGGPAGGGGEGAQPRPGGAGRPPRPPRAPGGG